MDRFDLGGRQDRNYRHYHRGIRFRQPPRYCIGHEAPQAENNHKLLRNFARTCRHARGHVRDDVQRECPNLRTLAILVCNVRRLEQFGRLLFHGFYSPSMLHQRRSLLCYREAIEVLNKYDKKGCGNNDPKHMDKSRIYKLRTNFYGVVYNDET